MNNTQFKELMAELRAVRALLTGTGDADSAGGAQTRDAFGYQDPTTGDPMPAAAARAADRANAKRGPRRK